MDGLLNVDHETLVVGAVSRGIASMSGTSGRTHVRSQTKPKKL